MPTNTTTPTRPKINLSNDYINNTIAHMDNQFQKPENGGKIKTYGKNAKNAVKKVGAKGTHFMKNAATRGTRFAGRASGVGDAVEQAKDFKTLAQDPLSREGLKAGINTANRVSSRLIATLAAGQEELAPVIRKVEEIAEKKEVIYIVCAIVLFIFTFWSSLGGLSNNQNLVQGTGQEQTNPLQVSVDCNPAQITKVGGTANCTVTVTYPGSAQDIVTTVTIYPHAQYVEKSANLQPSTTSPNTITWDAKQLGLLSANPIVIGINFNVQKTDNLSGVPITATATVTGGTESTGGNASANNDNCHGIYSSYMSDVQTVLSRLNIGGANYGDPNCQLEEQDPNGNWIINKDKELTYLETILPKEKAEGVFTCMIPNESSFNADAFNPNSTSATNGNGTPGAFGLLQMNAKGFSNTGQPDDVGDVVWSQQLTNAVNWVKNVHGGLWHGNYNGIPNYWPTSYNACLANYGM